MFTVAVKDHVMIAHTLKGEVFGPAQRLHGATYHVVAAFRAPELDADGTVIDIALARRALAETLAPLAYRNLDEVEALRGLNTTTEVLARHIHARLARRLAGAFSGVLSVTLEESHVAWAGYEAPVR